MNQHEHEGGWLVRPARTLVVFAQTLERHSATGAAVVASAFFGLVEISDGKTKVALVVAGIVSLVAAAVFNERRARKVTQTTDDLRQQVEASNAAVELEAKMARELGEVVKLRDRQLGRALDAAAKELGDEAALSSTDRVTLFGQTEVGDKPGLVRLARWSPNPNLAGGHREEYDISGYLQQTWEQGHCDTKIKTVSAEELRLRHLQDGLPEDQYKLLSLVGRRYIGYRMDTPGGDPVGVIMYESTEMAALSEVANIRGRLSLVQLILSVSTNSKSNEGG